MYKRLGRKTVVLLGVGHTNAHVLRMWKMNPPDNAQLICVSDFPMVTYSGMMPGVISGQYPKSAMEIDLIRLAQSAGARIIIGKVVGLDHANRRLIFENRPALSFDVLSIGIGSRPSFKGVEVGDRGALLAVKPMQTFLQRLSTKLNSIKQDKPQPRIAVVGGGVGSIEVAFCLYERFHGKPKHSTAGWFEGIQPDLHMVTGGKRIGSGLLDSSASKILAEFENRNITVRENARVTKIDSTGLAFKDGSHLEADVIVWATSAVGAPLLSELGLENDDRGFLSTQPDLQVTELPGVFAVGDTGTIVGSTTSKAGVYAVRQGPILDFNIRKLVAGQNELRKYRPQTDFLKLVNFGNDRALMEFKGRSFSGRFGWTTKDYIDKKFMKMYQDYQPMEMKVKPLSEDDQNELMRCLGCGGKIGSQILSTVLHELQINDHPDVKIGLDNPDDAAVIKTHDNEVTVTTDFFAAPFDDPYLVGRVAALNSASDCFVMGAQPTSALAIVQVPLGHPRAQTQIMQEIMSGSVEELNRMNAAVVGGHSIEGPRMMVGFTVLGRQVVPPTTKGQLAVGDKLVLTKQLGTGILLAAWMQCQMPSTCYSPLIDTVLQSNEIALELVQKFGILALTDVTGFGMVGHLVEMMRASGASVDLQADQIPLLPHCRAMVDLGIQSTLAPDNRTLVDHISLQNVDVQSDELAPLFDPQTGGGLLFGVKDDKLESVLKFLNDGGFEHSTVVGSVVGKSEIPVLQIK